MELIIKLLSFIVLVPPEGADARALYNHRVLLTGGFLIMALSSALHVALVCGYLTAVFPGFAKADEVNDLKKVQQTMLAAQLDNDIFRTREAQCRTASGDAKFLYTQRLQDKLQQWRNLQGYGYRMPECAEFGSAGTGGNGQ